MVERTNRASSTLVRVRSIIGEKQVVRAIGIVLSALLFWGLSKYLILGDVRSNQLVLFVAMVWTLAFVFDHLQIEKTDAQVIPTESEKLQSQKMEAIGRLAIGAFSPIVCSGRSLPFQ